MKFDTTTLDGQDQRRAPVETIALVIGTAGSAPHIHLHLEMVKRMFGNTLPVLIVNDGDEHSLPSEYHSELARLKAVVEQYSFAELSLMPYLGHSTGDIRVFWEGLDWAERIKASILVKFSRRFIPLENWRHELMALSALNRESAAFTRYHEGGTLFRTDCIALRVRKWRNERVEKVFSDSLKQFWKKVNVESIFESLTRTNGGWAEWRLAGPDFHRPWHRALQWRGCQPFIYGDLARQLELFYTDDDFVPAIASTIGSENSTDTRPHPPSSVCLVEDEKRMVKGPPIPEEVLAQLNETQSG